MTLYLVEKEASPMGGVRPVLRPVTVRLGIADSSSVEVLEGLKEGDVVASGVVSAAIAGSGGTSSAGGAPRANPFGGPFGGGRPR